MMRQQFCVWLEKKVRLTKLRWSNVPLKWCEGVLTLVLEVHHPACFSCFTALQQVFRSLLITHSYKLCVREGNTQDGGPSGPGLRTSGNVDFQCSFGSTKLTFVSEQDKALCSHFVELFSESAYKSVFRGVLSRWVQSERMMSVVVANKLIYKA